MTSAYVNIVIFMLITREIRTTKARPKQHCLFNGILPERLRGFPCILHYCKLHNNTYHALDKFSRPQTDAVVHISFYRSGSDTSCKSSPLETMCMKCQNLFSRKKYISICHLLNICLECIAVVLDSAINRQVNCTLGRYSISAS